MPWQPDPKMQVQLLVSHVRSRRKRWLASAGSVNSTQTRGRSRGASATGTPYAAHAGMPTASLASGRPGRPRCAGRGSASLVVVPAPHRRPPFGPTRTSGTREEAVMALSLPANPDLERFRRDARRLQRAVRSVEPDAVRYVARHHPAGPPEAPGSFALSDAQLVLARAYGFASWPRLRAYLRAAA